MNIQYGAFVDWTVYRYKRVGEAPMSLDILRSVLWTAQTITTQENIQSDSLWDWPAQGNHLIYKLTGGLAGISVASDEPQPIIYQLPTLE